MAQVMTTGGHPPPISAEVFLVPLAGDKAEVEMSKQGIRALIISAVIGLIFWVLFIICIAGVIYG
ncbi:TPA: hypothetical protein PCO36_001678 [Klebsiella oxytoca]|nr:hypothetical protein [Klebsiella oxytoca]